MRSLLAVDPAGAAASFAHAILRVSVASMVFFIHGLHKLEGGLRYLREGSTWQLAEEVKSMHLPAPVIQAFAATAAQLVCPVFIALGLFTRLNSAILAGALSGALAQNLIEGRDPQLVILYLLILMTLIFQGGGRYSLDARLVSGSNPKSSPIGSNPLPSGVDGGAS